MVIGIFCSDTDTVFVQLNQFSQILSRQCCLIALAAIFFAVLTIFDKKYRILTHRDKRESYLIVLQQNNV